jgi:hypothetical protein
METGTEQQEQQLQLLQGDLQHLQQDNVKVGAAGDRDRAAGDRDRAAGDRDRAAGDRDRAAGEQLQLLQGELQHLLHDNVKVEAGGNRYREVRATALAGEKSKERGAEFGAWCRNEAL